MSPRIASHYARVGRGMYSCEIIAETRQTLEKYLQLAPDGPQATDVKAMLDMVAK